MKINYKGNRWYKCDLHLHTPASECFIDKDVTAEQFIERAKEQNLDCIAITDHNTGEWIDKIKNAAEGKNIVVFPGVEITCSDSKIHLIILFDVSCNTQKVEDFILACGIKREALGSTEAHSNKTIRDILEIARENNGLVIPAHVDDFSGLCEVSLAIQKDFLKANNIHVVQAVNKELIIKKYKDFNTDELFNNISQRNSKITKERVNSYIKCMEVVQELQLGMLTFSDNPDTDGSTKHGLWGIGKSYSWIKMDEKPTLESLRQAFLFPKIRIKNNYECINVNEFPSVWIKKIKIENVEIVGNQPLEVEFNPQLNAIIGGRGSGKSTIIRFLTAIFSRESIDDFDEIKRDFEKFYNKNNKGGVLKDSTRLEVEVVKNNNIYIITITNIRSYNEYDTKIEKINEIGGMPTVLENIDIEDLFRFDIYNQKQIYQLAKNTNSLRDTIDSLITNMNISKENANKYFSDYVVKYATIKDIEMKLSSQRRIEIELQDIMEKIEVYKKTGIDKYSQFMKEKNWLLKNVDLLRNKEKELRAFLDKFEQINNKEPIEIDKKYKSEFEELININTSEFMDIVETLKENLRKIKSLKWNAMIRIVTSTWYSDYKLIKREYTDGLAKLNENGMDIESIKKLFIMQEYKQKELENLKDMRIKLDELYTELQEIKEKYRVARNEISDLRVTYTSEVLENKNIKIKIDKFRDRENFISMFREIIQKSDGYTESIEKITNECFGRGKIEDNIHKLIEDIKKIRYTNDDIKRFDGRFKSLIKKLNNEQMASLDLFLPEDDIKVEYKQNGLGSYKRLQNASAGQMTSTILTFILSDGLMPLVLDQPEDDLDNHLISDLVVEGLKESKQNRQIIVVTHNANIPVNGDAELMIEMNSNSKKVEVLRCGTIEDTAVKDEICNVMEGGKEAFLMRGDRYSLLSN